MSETKTNNEAGWNFNNSYVSLPEMFFSRITPRSVSSPKIVIFNEPLAKSLGLKSKVFQSNYGNEVLAGNHIPEGALPIAQAYAGHQFGHFTRLGDGRACLLGEQITPKGEQYDIHLKGSGETPYSRGGDGRAVLGPMLREYIISEAMEGLGIPTTRSLAVVTTGEAVIRHTKEQGAILTRVAASHIRVGTFQYAAKWGTLEDLKALADYTLQRHYPEVMGNESPYFSLLQEVIKRQALLISKWQLVGFLHGVMNTDNMTISGETIDYGPCAFMDTYDPKTVFSSIDIHGRYAFGNQPTIAAWNLARFAETLLPLLHKEKEEAIQIAQDEVSNFTKVFHANWLSGMRQKLGIFNEEPQDESMIEELLDLMLKYGADYTNTFRGLTLEQMENSTLFEGEEFSRWYHQWQRRLERQQGSKDEFNLLMRNSNPAVIPRNHRVEEALSAASEGDYSLMKRLLNVLSKPFAYIPEQEEYCTLPAPSNHPYRTFCGT